MNWLLENYFHHFTDTINEKLGTGIELKPKFQKKVMEKLGFLSHPFPYVAIPLPSSEVFVVPSSLVPGAATLLHFELIEGRTTSHHITQQWLRAVGCAWRHPSPDIEVLQGMRSVTASSLLGMFRTNSNLG